MLEINRRTPDFRRERSPIDDSSPTLPTQMPILNLDYSKYYGNFIDVTERCPQVVKNRIKYVVTGGYAARLLTEASGGKTRNNQHDWDLVVTTKDASNIPTFDNWDQGRYVQTMVFDWQALVDNHVTRIDVIRKGFLRRVTKTPIYITGAEFLVVSKLFGFGRSPRQKDIEDIQALLNCGHMTEERLKNALDLIRINYHNPLDTWGEIGMVLYKHAFLPREILALQQASGEGRVTELMRIANSLSGNLFIFPDTRNIPNN